MSSPIALKISEEQAKEMPMVDLAFLILKTANKPYYYRDLMQEIAQVRGLSEEEISEVIAQVYTEINIDGRFACVGSNVWGLKRWYPVDKSDESVSGSYPRIINDDDDDLDDEDVFGDEEDTYGADSDVDFDAIDEGADEEFIDEVDEIDDEEVEGVDDEVLDEDEALEDESVEDDDSEDFDDK